MKNKAIDSFKVVLNWKGIFEAVTCVFGIMMCLILFLCLIVEYIRTGENSIGVYILLFMPIALIGVIFWKLSHLISDRIIVDNNKIVIKRAFKKKQEITPNEIVSYSSTIETARMNRYSEIAIKFCDSESIYISNGTYKNYDLLLYYLSKNCPRK